MSEKRTIYAFLHLLDRSILETQKSEEARFHRLQDSETEDDKRLRDLRAANNEGYKRGVQDARRIIADTMCQLEDEPK